MGCDRAIEDGLTEGNASPLAKLKAFLKSDGHTLADPSKLPWCGRLGGDLHRAQLPEEPAILNPYYALHWAKFGVALSGGAIGEILVFKREGRGHVGFYVGEDATRFGCSAENEA